MKVQVKCDVISPAAADKVRQSLAAVLNVSPSDIEINGGVVDQPPLPAREWREDGSIGGTRGPTNVSKSEDIV